MSHLQIIIVLAHKMGWNSSLGHPSPSKLQIFYESYQPFTSDFMLDSFQAGTSWQSRNPIMSTSIVQKYHNYYDIIPIITPHVIKKIGCINNAKLRPVGSILVDIVQQANCWPNELMEKWTGRKNDRWEKWTGTCLLKLLRFPNFTCFLPRDSQS